MIRGHSRSGRRSAFTLVELMVVILIIAILVSLISAAVMKAMGKIPEVQTRTEISELATGLQGFMSDYNLAEPPPSSLILYENISIYNTAAAVPGSSYTYAFLQKTFGKNLGYPPTVGFPWVDWNGDGIPNGPGGNVGTPWILEGEQCLVFYLGGIPSATGPQGFSTNNMIPSAPGGKRKGPYYPFDLTRLKPISALQPQFLAYVDAWQSKMNTTFYVAWGGTPYAYFSSRGINNGYNLTLPPGGDCPTIAAAPYFLSGTTQCMNPNTYQIISAGRNGVFGTIGWIPQNGALGAGADDQSNFSGGILGAGQQ